MHRPVLLDPVLAAAGEPSRVVDATLGDGGHAAGFLAGGAQVLGVDRDPGAIARARERLGGRPILIQGRFDDPAVLERVREFRPEFALFDLGVSSRQLDDPALGFSFRPDVPLDMRMDRAGPTAADWLNSADQRELALVFQELADEPKARRLAGEILRRREGAPFRTSDDLVRAIRAVLGPRSGPADFARIFQAVRIIVNDELGRLERALPAYRDMLPPQGTLAVISYHSGEDRIVKQAFREWARDCICPPEFPVCTCRGRGLGAVVTLRPIRPDPAEIEANPRARSAKLRIFRVAG